ncbi:MAG: ABC transporter permease, partial [Gemmatimonadota bacterium]
MLVGETISVAFSSIRANKLRSVLTMLGIIIGVGAVIVVVSLGTGAQKAVEERITALGANLLQIYPGQSFQGGRASEQRVSMTVDDAEALRRDARLLSGVVPEMRRSLQIKYGSQNLNVNVTGTTANYATVRNFKVQYGRMFTQGDDESRQRYAVVGSQVPELLNVNAAALIGQTLQIRGIPFEVVGVLEKKGSQGFFNPDEQILIPLQTARYRVFGTDRLNQISVQVATNVPVEQAMVDIERIMRREHKIRPG